MSKIFLIRHAESAANAGGRTSDPANIGLTEKGFEQTTCLANTCTSSLALVATSPYVRTKQTAKPLLERFATIEQVEWAVQEFTYLAPERCQNTTSQERRPLVAEYWARSDPFFNDGVGAESFADFMKRVDDFIGNIKSSKQEGTVIVSHGQFIRGVIWRLLSGNAEVSSTAMKQFRNFMSAVDICNASTVKLQAETDGSLWVTSVDQSYLPLELLS